jgi:RimJ/RimL family protein N-acetyltransferase
MIAMPAEENTKLVGAYVGQKCGCTFEDGMFQALAVLNDNGEFCAGIVISEYRGHDCQISCATETSVAWRPSVIATVFEYIFTQLGCARCTSITKKTNKRTRAFLEGLGFKLEGRLRRGFDGTQDALLYGLLAEECRYLHDADNGLVDADETESIPH